MMKNVVITGSSRGFGFAMAAGFLKSGCQVTLTGKNIENLKVAAEQLNAYEKRLLIVTCDVRNPDDIANLWQKAYEKWGRIDIWINNAGINQPDKPLWEISENDIINVIETNLTATIQGSKIAVQEMLKQGGGQLYNMEGFGSNGMMRKGLNLYGTTKSAITHFTKALSKEVAGTGIQVGALSPGMMVTDFIKGPASETTKAEVSSSARKIFNILGDKPETVAEFMVKKILDNKKNGAHFMWLTGSKTFFRFAKSLFVKRNLFE